MHRPLSRVLLTFLPVLLTVPATAQSLRELQQQFLKERDQLVDSKGGDVTFEDMKGLATKHAGVLSNWLPSAKGAEAVNGRLMLTNIWIDVGEEAKAKKTLLALSVNEAPALELAMAAEMAQMLGETATRERWITAAIEKQVPFEERMALAIVLMTRLVEVEKGEKIIDDAFNAAENDEERAHVMWYRAAAMREREDLEGAFESTLEDLAKKFPGTFWGSVAKDRLAALELRVGSPAIQFAGKTLDGKQKKLADFKGKVTLLEFWMPGFPEDRSHELMKSLTERYGARGFEVITIAIGEDAAAMKQAVAATQRSWTVFFDGQGFASPPALRWGVEDVPHYVLLDADQKVAAMRLFLRDDYGRRELTDAIEASLPKK